MGGAVSLRYVILPEDPDLATIDDALRRLRTQRIAATLPVTGKWITEDIDELLEMRHFKLLTTATPAT